MGRTLKYHRSLDDRPPGVLVIGAGMSGLACAWTLADHGLDATVVEKSRGVGGRMATRRQNGFSFDHGAQYFTARDTRFRRSLDSWLQAGVVQPWEGRIVSLRAQQIEAEKTRTSRFVACPGMNGICKHLANDLTIMTQTHVGGIAQVGHQWRILDDEGHEIGVYDIVISSAPAAQTIELLRGFSSFTGHFDDVGMAGCWAVMLQFAERLDLDFDGAFVQESSLSWVARNNSKPARNSAVEAWVLHAAPEWSALHLEETPEFVQEQLVAAFWSATGLAERSPEFAAVHRWRYALPTRLYPERCLYDKDLRIGACGDWCGEARVEGAFLSGTALARMILSEF